MSLLLGEDASCLLAKHLTRESDPLYDRWIPLWSAWSLRYRPYDIISRARRILYPLLLSGVVYVREGEGSAGIKILQNKKI